MLSGVRVNNFERKNTGSANTVATLQLCLLMTKLNHWHQIEPNILLKYHNYPIILVKNHCFLLLIIQPIDVNNVNSVFMFMDLF